MKADKSKKIKFYHLSDRREIVTGGHKYDKDLFDIFTSTPGILTEKAVVGSSNSPIYKKPLVEFRKSLIAKKDADIIVYNSSSCLRLLPGFLWLRLFSRKKIYTIHHHFIYLEFKGVKRLIYRFAENTLLKKSHKLIVPSPYIYNELKKIRKEENLLLWRIPFELRQSVKPNPIKGNLTFAGTIEPRKGLIFLLKALNILQKKSIEYRLNILGKVVDQTYYKQIKDYINENQLKVNFLGFVEKKEKEKILSETDIFVFPSLLEGFGMVLIEAQVYGLPIICFNNSAMPYTVKDNINGFVVPNLDVESFADKLAEVITDRELREKLSKNAIENLKNQWDFSQFECKVKDYLRSI